MTPHVHCPLIRSKNFSIFSLNVSNIIEALKLYLNYELSIKTNKNAKLKALIFHSPVIVKVLSRCYLLVFGIQ